MTTRDTTKNETLSALQKEILKRWKKKDKNFITQEIKDLLKIKFDGEILFNEPMSQHTYMRIGGPADIFLKPNSHDALVYAVNLAHEQAIPCWFHGSGANTLIRDGGIRGFVISVYDMLKDITVVEQNESYVDIEAGAGARFSKLVSLCKEMGLSDIMPMTGIPGSIGGIIKMNAGVPQKEIKDVVRNIKIITKEGEQKTISREHLDFTYRDLKLSKSNIIVSALFRFKELTSTEEAQSLMKQFQEQRVSKQPLDYPSCGSVFKNPQPAHRNDIVVPAGKMIEEADLKNVRIGGARISAKHANFIINENNATASDVIALINLVKDKIKQLFDVQLETEVKILGEDKE
ncbi:MAG: UDP-N-acetylmuramate dehydrogenase [bacterium]|nr:UDP-N-acetylmuramate dehydrogenase [bacterium]MBU1918473.1 UDP-N-acetylmuramate dehydrogenase [bacterium]